MTSCQASDGILAYVADGISVTEAARLLNTSPQTVRDLLERQELSGTRIPRGKRFSWEVDKKCVLRFAAKYGQFQGRRRRAPSAVAKLEAQVAELQGQVGVMTRDSRVPGAPSRDLVAQERDDLRARVVALEEALVATRNVADLQRRADVERAAVVSHLLEAAAASERADALRREAAAALDEAVAAFSRPGHLGSL